MEPRVTRITITPHEVTGMWTVGWDGWGIFTDETQVKRGRVVTTDRELLEELIMIAHAAIGHEEACRRLGIPT